jgi:tetratricopeptide (TPR) repeat protein
MIDLHDISKKLRNALVLIVGRHTTKQYEGGIMRAMLCVFALTCFFQLTFSSALAAADSELDRALKDYGSGKYERAVVALKEYVEEKPSASAYYLIGYGLYKLGRHGESVRYFEDSYLIDPTFSPEKIEFPPIPLKKARSKKLPVKKAPLPSERAAVMKKSVPSQKDMKKDEMKKAEEKKVVSRAEPRAPTEKVEVRPGMEREEPKRKITPPTRRPGIAGIKKMTPSIPSFFTKGMPVLFIAVGVAFYIFLALCLFLIARKLAVPASWTAWIPLVQIWAYVSAAGKRWWWILLLLIPLVNYIVAIYLWMCISENLGKNRWLGLLMIVPVVNFFFLGFLAFSKHEEARYNFDTMTPV